MEISGGFWLLAVWFGLVNGWRLLGIILSAAAIHELAHYLTLRACGAEVAVLRLSVFGAVMETDSECLSYGRELAAALAGPAANFLCAFTLAATQRPEVIVSAGVHLTLGVFNLLPVRPLDGGRALGLALDWALGPCAGERAAGAVSACTAAVLAAGFTAVIIGSGGSVWLLPAVFGLLAVALGEMGVNPQNFAIGSYLRKKSRQIEKYL